MFVVFVTPSDRLEASPLMRQRAHIRGGGVIHGRRSERLRALGALRSQPAAPHL
jgi:hypothetical protein